MLCLTDVFAVVSYSMY